MTRKLFPSLLRLAASLIFVIGISYPYAQAYQVSRGSYVAGSAGQYQRYYDGEYRYGNDAPSQAVSYGRSFANRYLSPYEAVAREKYFGYAAPYEREHFGRQYKNYSDPYAAYAGKNRFDLRLFSEYRYRDYAPEKESSDNARSATDYFTYRYDKAILSSAYYDGGLQMMADA